MVAAAKKRGKFLSDLLRIMAQVLSTCNFELRYPGPHLQEFRRLILVMRNRQNGAIAVFGALLIRSRPANQTKERLIRKPVREFGVFFL